jgi:hypothetical protein
MKTRQFAKYLGAIASLGAIVFALSNLSPVSAENEESQSKIGLRIAPVPLNMRGKNPELVGYGSFLVNAVADCNGCHTADPSVEFSPGGTPYFSEKPTKVNPAVYLGGGSSFGSLIPGTAEIVSRNLTPDKTGLPEGGHTFQEFLMIIRTGVDMDMLHPNCPGAPGPNCLLRPFDGSLLQVMPWPTFAKMTDHDLRAIYEYLSAVPCVSGPPAPSPLHNACQ